MLAMSLRTMSLRCLRCQQRPMPAAREPGPPSAGPPMLSGMERRGLSSHRPPPVVTGDAASRGRAVPGIGVALLVHQSIAVTAAGPAHAPCCGPALTVRLRRRRSAPAAADGRASDRSRRLASWTLSLTNAPQSDMDSATPLSCTAASC